MGAALSGSDAVATKLGPPCVASRSPTSCWSQVQEWSKAESKLKVVTGAPDGAPGPVAQIKSGR